MWVSVMDFSLCVSPSLLPGNAKTELTAAYPGELTAGACFKILPTPRPLGEPPLDLLLHGPDGLLICLAEKQLPWMRGCFHEIQVVAGELAVVSLPRPVLHIIPGNYQLYWTSFLS